MSFHPSVVLSDLPCSCHIFPLKRRHPTPDIPFTFSLGGGVVRTPAHIGLCEGCHPAAWVDLSTLNAAARLLFLVALTVL